MYSLSFWPWRRSAILVASLVTGGALPAATSTWTGISGTPDTVGDYPWTLVNSTASSPALAGGSVTLSTPANGQNMGYYQTDAVLAVPAQWDIFARVKVDADSTSHPARRGTIIQFTTGAFTGGAFYLGTDGVFFTSDNLTQGAFAAVDTSTFHDYHIQVNGAAAGSLISLYLDGDVSPLISGQLFTHTSAFGPSAQIFWGDAGLLAHGTSEWESFEHNALIPEPNGSSLLAGGSCLFFLLVGGARRRRRFGA